MVATWLRELLTQSGDDDIGPGIVLSLLGLVAGSVIGAGLGSSPFAIQLLQVQGILVWTMSNGGLALVSHFGVFGLIILAIVVQRMCSSVLVVWFRRYCFSWSFSAGFLGTASIVGARYLVSL